MTERRYRMVRVAAGDYILPSNDGRTLWRIATYVERGDAAWVDADGNEHAIVGTFWASWKYDRPFHNQGEWTDPDFLEWHNWLHWEGPFNTRREAVDSALRR